LRRFDDGGGASCSLDPGPGKFGFEFGVSIGVGHGSESGAELAREPRQRRRVAMRRDCLDLVARSLLP